MIAAGTAANQHHSEGHAAHQQRSEPRKGIAIAAGGEEDCARGECGGVGEEREALAHGSGSLLAQALALRRTSESAGRVEFLHEQLPGGGADWPRGRDVGAVLALRRLLCLLAHEPQGNDLAVHGSSPRLGFDRFASRADSVLLPGATRQGHIGDGETWAEGNQAIGQTEFDVLASVDDLIQGPASGAGLLGQRLALVDREVEVMLFEAVHNETIPVGTVYVNTSGSYTCRYASATINTMDNYERLQALLSLIRTKFCNGKAAELARRIERSDSYVNRLFYPAGKNGAKGIGPEIMAACTAAFELPRAFWEMSPEEAAIEIAGGEKPAAAPPPSMPEGSIPVDPAKAHRIWVVGKGSGGLSERIWTDGDHPVGATDQYGLVASTDPQAFLVEVSEESMIPKYTPGDFALVEPGTTPELEDDVLVRLQSGVTMIKRLLSQRGAYRLGSYNSTAVLHYRFEDVDWIYYIAHPVPRRKITTLW